MTLANKITVSRICGIPLFMVLMGIASVFKQKVTFSFWCSTAGFFIFIALSFTDWIDGHVARIRKEVTFLGEFLDPLADKLLVISALLYFINVDWIKVYWWMIVIIISREFIITGLRVVAAHQKISIAALTSGKVKTTVQMIAIITTLFIIVLKNATRKWGFCFKGLDVVFSMPFYLVLFATLTTLYSGISYVVQYAFLFRDAALFAKESK